MLAADTGVSDIAAAVRSGKVSAVETARAALARIAATDSRLNCFTAITAKRTLAEAAAVDAARAAGRDPGALAGVPYAVKNLFDVTGLPTLAGSKINAAPWREDLCLRVAAALEAAGVAKAPVAAL